MTNTIDRLPERGGPTPEAVEALTVDIGGVLDSMEQVSDYLERVVHAVRRHVGGCDEVGVTILGGDRPSTAAYTTVQTLEIDALQYALGDGPCLDAARHRRVNRVDDLVVDDFDASLVRVAAARCADAVVAVSALEGVRRLAGRLEQAMASRAVIEQAKGVIMALHGVPEHEAFEVLRRTSQDRNTKVRVVAQRIVMGVVARDGADPA